MQKPRFVGDNVTVELSETGKNAANESSSSHQNSNSAAAAGEMIVTVRVNHENNDTEERRNLIKDAEAFLASSTQSANQYDNRSAGFPAFSVYSQ